MLADLGAQNIADSDKGLLSDYSIEALIQDNPQTIFLLPMGNSDESAQQALAEQTTQNPAWAQLDAVKNGRVVTLDPQLFQYSRMLSGMKRIKSCSMRCTANRLIRAQGSTQNGCDDGLCATSL